MAKQIVRAERASRVWLVLVTSRMKHVIAIGRCLLLGACDSQETPVDLSKTEAGVLAGCLALLVALCVGGCAAASRSLDATNSAELAFANVASPGGLPGSFDSLDGKRFEGRPPTIRVPPGEHVIEYSCPDVLSVDFQASTKASFVAGHRYLLECGANQPGAVREQ